MNSVKRRVEFDKWLTKCVMDAQDELGLSVLEVVMCLAERLHQIALSEYAKQIRTKEEKK